MNQKIKRPGCNQCGNKQTKTLHTEKNSNKMRPTPQWPTLATVSRLSMDDLWLLYPRLLCECQEHRDIEAAMEAHIFETAEKSNAYLRYRFREQVTSVAHRITAKPETIERYRKFRGWTRERLALALGTKTQTVSAAERGERQLPKQALIELACLLKTAQKRAPATIPPTANIQTVKTSTKTDFSTPKQGGSVTLNGGAT